MEDGSYTAKPLLNGVTERLQRKTQTPEWVRPMQGSSRYVQSMNDGIGSEILLRTATVEMAVPRRKSGMQSVALAMLEAAQGKTDLSL